MSRRITAWLLCLLLCVLPVFAGNVPEPEQSGSPSRSSRSLCRKAVIPGSGPSQKPGSC